MRRAAIGMYAATAISVLILVVPDPDGHDRVSMALIGCLPALAAAALTVVRTPPAWALRAAPFAGILIVSVAVALARPIDGIPFSYLWPVLYCAYFLSRRDLFAALALLAITYAAALTVGSEPESEGLLLASATASVALAGAVVRLIRGRLEALVSELEETARTDGLTGLPNRRAFEHTFERELARASRNRQPLTVALFDLDYFKQLNDSLGHAAGDAALQRFARLLSAQTRAGDLAARVGGEEFAVLLVDSGPGPGVRLAKRIRRGLRVASAAADPTLSVSVGVATATGESTTASDLLALADQALYAAKAAGRRRVAVWDGDSFVVVDGDEPAGDQEPSDPFIAVGASPSGGGFLG